MYGLMVRIMRTSVLDSLGEEYVRTAEAKGLSRWRVLRRHVLRNAMLPAVTVLGLEFGLLAAGVFVVESVFQWPGLGNYAFQAIQANDYNATMGATLVIAVMSIVFVHSAVAGGATGDSLSGRLLAHLNIGVAIFFVVSGFLLYRPFVAHRGGGA